MASSQQLSFAVRAVNEAQKTLKEIQGQLGDTSEVAEKEAGRFSKAWGGVKTTLGDVGKIAGGVLLAQGVSQIPGLVSSISDRARDLELQGKKASTVFEDSLGTVQKWAKESAGAMGLSSREATNLATNLGDLLIPMGMSREEAAALSTKTIGLAGALSEWSVGAKSAAEVSDVLTKAYLGETDGLKALGISISAAEVSSRLLEKGQQDLTGEALAQAKALAIQELIFEKSTDAQNAFAEGAGSAARKQAEMKAAMAEAKDEIAVQLQPALTAITVALATKVVPAIAALVKWVNEDLAPAIRRFVAEYGPAVQEFWETQVKPALDALLLTFSTIVGWIRDHWPEIEAIVRPVLEQVVLMIQSVMTILGNLISFIVNVFQGDWSAAWEDVKDIFFGWWNYITGSIENFAELIRGVIPLVKDAAKALGKAIIDGIVEGVKSAGDFLTDIAGAIGRALKDWINLNIIDHINRAMEVTVSVPNPFGKDPSVTINPPDIPYLARGGIVTRPTLALIGEEGPEAVVPLSRGRSGSFAAAGGITINVNLPNYLGDRREVAREIARELRMVLA